MLLDENQVFVVVEEVRGQEALIRINGISMPVPINDETEQMLQEIVNNHSAVLPYNISDNEFLVPVTEQTIQDYPELQNKALIGSTDFED